MREKEFDNINMVDFYKLFHNKTDRLISILHLRIMINVKMCDYDCQITVGIHLSEGIELSSQYINIKHVHITQLYNVPTT